MNKNNKRRTINNLIDVLNIEELKNHYILPDSLVVCLLFFCSVKK